MAPKYTRVPIEDVDTTTAVLAAAVANTICRLHKLVVTCDVAGTILIEDTDSGALSGDMHCLAGIPLVIPFSVNDHDCNVAPIGTGIQITTGDAFNGYAIVSSELVIKEV